MATNTTAGTTGTTVPTRDLSSFQATSEILGYIPEDAAAHYKVVPIGVKDGVLEIGALDPSDLDARDALNFITSRLGIPYKLFLISKKDFDTVIKQYQGITEEVDKALEELDTAFEAEASPSEAYEQEHVDAAKIVEDAPVTKVVGTILNYASEGNASDIHIEPTHDNVRVRFRVDGELNTSLVLPLKVHSAVVARIKILSNMRLDEKRKPQDGRFSAKVGGRKVDFRVSTFPTYYGEKVVMRILDQNKELLSLDTLGFTDKNLTQVREALKRPYGMILISGPTGSGKSTTLYAMLKEVDREHLNVLSLEDPVEYSIDGVSQSQIQPEIDYTFATGLRTTLRQDPDIIMVGEIRDKETAQLAIQAALTGHLVFSTIHTNTAIGVIPRLIDMGVDPYLIAPTLALVMAQRLVRKLCDNTGKPIPIEDSLKLMLDKEFADLPETYKKELNLTDKMYGVQPTPTCLNGTSGRVSVHEVFSMDKEIEVAILKGATEPELYQVLRNKGMLSLKEDAILKSMKGIVPFEEVNTL